MQTRLREDALKMVEEGDTEGLKVRRGRDEWEVEGEGVRGVGGMPRVIYMYVTLIKTFSYS